MCVGREDRTGNHDVLVSVVGDFGKGASRAALAKRAMARMCTKRLAEDAKPYRATQASALTRRRHCKLLVTSWAAKCHVSSRRNGYRTPPRLIQPPAARG